MKDIDFIPEWYKANQNRKKRYHRQYALLISLLAVMMAWSFVIGQYVEQVRSEVEGIGSVFEKGQEKINQGMLLESDIALLQHQAGILDAVTPRTKVSAIIAELSWQVRDTIVLSKLSLTKEPVQLDQEKSSPSTGVVQIGSSSRGKTPNAELMAPTRTRIVLTGYATQGADAAILISRLEESAYFDHVSPIYTKAVKVKDCDVTEFEICCYVADYKIEK